ncbi:MAG TPA: hypothetical protein VHY30_06800 [Verrucomicrobiae bacterium]|jgi:hypothetical protein|nr:hypothetical protein [Verrucomicrobiae bacterium]
MTHNPAINGWAIFGSTAGTPSSEYAAPDGAFSFCELLFYRYFAPTALSSRVSTMFNLWQNLFPKTIMENGQKSQLTAWHALGIFPRLPTSQNLKIKGTTP